MHTLSAMLPAVKSKVPLQPSFLKELQDCWPALKGSLALVRKPCIRPNCRACASGKKHPNYLLAYTEKGRRRCLYVPLAMVPVIKRALANGRRIEALLYKMGPALLREYRTREPAQTGPAARVKVSSPRKTSSKS